MTRARFLHFGTVAGMLTVAAGALAQDRSTGPLDRYQAGQPYPYYGYDQRLEPPPWADSGSAREYGVDRDFDQYADPRWPQQAFEAPQDIDRPLDRTARASGAADGRLQGPVGPFQDPSYPPFSYNQDAYSDLLAAGPYGRELNRFGRPGEYPQFGRYDEPQDMHRQVFENTALEQDLLRSGAMMGQRIPVVAAGELVGNTVSDPSGNEIGTVSYVVLGTRTGLVHFLMVSRGGPELTAVPWRAAQINADNSLSVQLPERALSDLPRIAASELAGLTGAQVLGRIQQVRVLPLSGGGGQESEASTSTEASASTTATQGGAQGSDSEAQQTTQGSGDKAAAQHHEPRQQGQAEKQDLSQQPQTQQRASAAESSQSVGSETEEAILIGRAGAVVAAPGLSTVGELLGTAVYGAEGRPVGEIDELVLDKTHGRVLYALVSTGGFLGADTRSVPVPFSAMSWVPGDMGFALRLHSRQFADAPKISGGEVPRNIPMGDLYRLYALYGLAFTGQEGDRSDAGGRAGLGPEEIRQRIERAGFAQVLWLERDGDVYRGEAVRNGAPWNLVVDARIGVIRETWMTPLAVRNHLRMQGFEQIGTIMRDGRTYATSAFRNGQEVELLVDAHTGAVTSAVPG